MKKYLPMARRPDVEPLLRPPMKRLRSELSLTLAPSTPSPPNPDPVTAPTVLGHRLPDLKALKPEERGVRLVQLLLAYAAHTATSNVTRADACRRLISFLSSPSGDSMQRLAARLASSLSARLFVLRHRRPATSGNPNAHLTFARALPYIPFALAVAGRALLRTLAQERVVHLVDLGANRASVDLWGPVLHALSWVPC